MIRKLLLLFWIFSASVAGMAQNCFEIERVLVDACSEPEGENEMVFLQIGNAALNTSNLTVSWPTAANNWLGICKNGATALKTDSLNKSIQSCGWLIEPTGGVLPAGAKVIVITSTNVQALANSFATLSDTVYVIYQCSGNTNGHFGNYSSTPGTRTLQMTFSGGGGCSETVTYERSQLININGTSGGSSTLQDGASVAFTNSGTPSYYNNGCQAPYIPSIIAAGNDTSVCGATPIQLHGTKSGISNIRWISTQGTFDTATILNPVFTPQSGNATIEVILSGYNACDTIYDTLVVSLTSGNAPLLTIDRDTICASDSAEICAPSGFTSYAWNNGETTRCFHTNLAGNYYVVVNSAGCQATSAPVKLNVRPQPSVSIIRQGDTLSSYNAVSYQWLFNHTPIPNATSAVYIATESGLYAVQITDVNGCKATSTDVNLFVSGMEELSEKLVEVSPNPSSGWLQVKYLSPFASGLQFILTDALGRKVVEHDMQSIIEEITLGALMRGTYFWQLNQKGQSLAHGKVLIK